MKICRKAVLLITAPALWAGSVGLAVEQREISELNYDWSLNERKTKPGDKKSDG